LRVVRRRLCVDDDRFVRIGVAGLCRRRRDDDPGCSGACSCRQATSSPSGYGASSAGGLSGASRWQRLWLLQLERARCLGLRRRLLSGPTGSIRRCCFCGRGCLRHKNALEKIGWISLIYLGKALNRWRPKWRKHVLHEILAKSDFTK